MNRKIAIIDPASTEFNRGSFCYLPYITYSCLKAENYDVDIWEDFTLTQLDSILDWGYDEIIICLWSYPQIDAALALQRFIPREKTMVAFTGYFPLIEHLNLFPVFKLSVDQIRMGCAHYPIYYKDFKFLLLSDCDMHLKKYEGEVYPFFTSYGCPNKCAFCPSTVNCDYKRIELSDAETLNALQLCHSIGVRNIHFTDEDFFFNIERTKRILDFAIELQGFNFIALGSAVKVKKFIDKYGTDYLASTPLILIEIGLESADIDIQQKMGKKTLGTCAWLAENCPVDIFWLTMTFFPGETVQSLNYTGDFLQMYGKHPDDLYARIATNSTPGGLGQFFQLYHGVKDYKDMLVLGTVISDRPVRLIPSYIPSSFMYCEFIYDENLLFGNSVLEFYMKMYNLPGVPTDIFENCEYINEVIDKLVGNYGWTVGNAATFLAICARLRIIEQA